MVKTDNTAVIFRVTFCYCLYFMLITICFKYHIMYHLLSLCYSIITITITVLLLYYYFNTVLSLQSLKQSDMWAANQRSGDQANKMVQCSKLSHTVKTQYEWTFNCNELQWWRKRECIQPSYLGWGQWVSVV